MGAMLHATQDACAQIVRTRNSYTVYALSSVGDFPVLILMDNQSGAPKQSKVVSIPKIPVFAVTFYLL